MVIENVFSSTSFQVKKISAYSPGNIGICHKLLLCEQSSHVCILFMSFHSSSFNLASLFFHSFVGWLCLLHHCLEVCKDKTETRQQVMSAIANCPGVVEACCSLFLTRNINSDPPLYTPYLQNVLLSLGLHSREIGLLEINVLLHNASAVFLQGNPITSFSCL